jgi:hypothetical protein
MPSLVLVKCRKALYAVCRAGGEAAALRLDMALCRRVVVGIACAAAALWDNGHLGSIAGEQSRLVVVLSVSSGQSLLDDLGELSSACVHTHVLVMLLWFNHPSDGYKASEQRSSSTIG